MTRKHPYLVKDAMLDRPDFAATIGKIVSQASYLETQLADLFCRLAGVDEDRGELLYWSYSTFNQRREVMDSLIDRTVPKYATRAGDIIKRAKAFMKFRNSTVHNLWTMTSEGSPMIRVAVNVARDEGEKPIKIRRRDMNEQIKVATAINADLAELLHDIQHGIA